MFVKQKALSHIEPRQIIREGKIWFTNARRKKTVCAFSSAPPALP
ncbi:MAG: hypothetical protein ACLFT3_16665 [Cyclobacteriaceae bacterium]